MRSSILAIGQWKEGSRPPFQLKVGQIQKAVGCLRLIIITFFSLLISCCISCAGVAAVMNGQNVLAIVGVGMTTFVIIFWMLSRLSRSRYRKAYGKTAVLHESYFQFNDGDQRVTGSINYAHVSSVNIKKAKTEQLGYEFERSDGTVYDVDPDLALFPSANYPIENSILPVVLKHWDEVILRGSGQFMIINDVTAGRLRRGAYFWFACGIPLVFAPNWWGTVADFFSRGMKLYQQAKYCGDPFVIRAEGIYFQHSPEKMIPLDQVVLAKHDDVAVVIQSRTTGEEFKAPITAKRAYTAGHWLKQKRAAGRMVSQPGPHLEPSSPHRDVSDLKSDLF